MTMLDMPAPPAPDTLNGRVVLVTGASRGLGRAVAMAAAGYGARVLLLARDVRRLEEAADAIEASGAPAPLLVPCNLENATVDDYAAIASHVREQCGHLDGLVLNAAMLGTLCPFEHQDPVLWARVFQVNVHAPFLLLQACLPLLRAAPSASVIGVSSSVGRRGRAYWGAYAASKFALEGMLQTLADELRDVSHVRVNSVNPGRLRTRMRAEAYPAEDPTTLPTPEDVAPAFVHLLGSEHAYHGVALTLPAATAVR